jgi:hypothetical protein
VLLWLGTLCGAEAKNTRIGGEFVCLFGVSGSVSVPTLVVSRLPVRIDVVVAEEEGRGWCGILEQREQIPQALDEGSGENTGRHDERLRDRFGAALDFWKSRSGGA